MNQLLYKDEVYAIQGAIIEVHKIMGNGWREEVYQQALEIELAERGIPFDAKRELPIFYKNTKLEKTYIPDIICYDKIILELKAVDKLTIEHQAQLFNYMRMTKSKLGLLVNFGAYPKATIERFVL
ncbi:MAG: GxxExxY protein [Kiritimatiellae bacterium]|nr:GxxExxY protein [Kiritimatiellia bacterium]